MSDVYEGIGRFSFASPCPNRESPFCMSTRSLQMQIPIPLRVLKEPKKFRAATETAANRRHPGVIDAKYGDSFTEEDNARYDKLNERLHRAIQKVAIKQFGRKGAEEYTYQNWDWYGPSYQCYVSVIRGHLGPEFLTRLHALLCGDFKEWAIVVRMWGDFMEADTEGGEVYIYSDEVVLLQSTCAETGLDG
jgi:hypothetical protein